MEFEAHIYYWTRDGMTTTQPHPHATRYITVDEAIDLCERSHRHGYQQGEEHERNATGSKS